MSGCERLRNGVRAEGPFPEAHGSPTGGEKAAKRRHGYRQTHVGRAVGVYGSPLPVPSQVTEKTKDSAFGWGWARNTGEGERRKEKATQREGWWEASQSHHCASVWVHFRSLSHERGRRMDSLTGYQFPQICLMVKRGEEAEGLARLW